MNGTDNTSVLTNMTNSSDLAVNLSRQNYEFYNPFDEIHFRVFFIILYSVVFATCIIDGDYTTVSPDATCLHVDPASTQTEHYSRKCCLKISEGNAMVLFAIARSPRLRSMTNFFLGNLAIADFCVGAFCVLPNLSLFLSQNWILGRAMCKIYYYVWNVSYTASIIILTVIAAERYIAIIHPLKSRNFLTNKKVKVIQFVIWITALIYNIPYLVLYDTIPVETYNKEFCYPDFENLSSLKVLSLLNLLVWYVLPLMLIGFMYYRVGIALWKTTVVSALRLNLQVESEETSFRSDATRQTQINRTSFNRFSNTNNRSRASTFKLSERGNSSNSTGSQDSHCSENAVLYARNETTKDTVFSTKKCEYSDLHDFKSVDGISNHDMGNSCSRARNRVLLKFRTSFNSKQSMRYRETIVSSSRRVSRARKKVIRLLVCVVVTFGICTLPHMMKVMNHYWGLITLPQGVDVILSPVSFVILYVNSVMNPILYALFSKNFRRSFKEVTPCFRSKSSKY